MEFLLGFLLGGACVLYVLVRWVNSRSTHKKTATDYAHDPIIDDFQAESDAFLQELRDAFGAHSRKRRP